MGRKLSWMAVMLAGPLAFGAAGSVRAAADQQQIPASNASRMPPTPPYNGQPQSRGVAGHTFDDLAGSKGYITERTHNAIHGCGAISRSATRTATARSADGSTTIAGRISGRSGCSRNPKLRLRVEGVANAAFRRRFEPPQACAEPEGNAGMSPVPTLARRAEAEVRRHRLLASLRRGAKQTQQIQAEAAPTANQSWLKSRTGLDWHGYPSAALTPVSGAAARLGLSRTGLHQ